MKHYNSFKKEPESFRLKTKAESRSDDFSRPPKSLWKSKGERVNLKLPPKLRVKCFHLDWFPEHNITFPILAPLQAMFTLISNSEHRGGNRDLKETMNRGIIICFRVRMTSCAVDTVYKLYSFYILPCKKYIILYLSVNQLSMSPSNPQ